VVLVCVPKKKRKKEQKKNKKEQKEKTKKNFFWKIEGLDSLLPCTTFLF
jgi:hypothetical protein